MTGYRCVYKCCSSKSGEEIALFKFPKDRLRCELWLKAIGRENISQKNIKKYRLCEKHFEEKFVSTSTRGKRLFDNAVPSLFCVSGFKHICEETPQQPPKKIHILSSDMESTRGTLKKSETISKQEAESSDVEIKVTLESSAARSSRSTGSLETLDTQRNPEVKIEHIDVFPSIPIEEIDTEVPGTSSMEFLPESEHLTKPKKVEKSSTSTKNYCRLCLKPATKNQLVCLGDFHDLTYPSRSEQFKRNKILQTEMYVRMINSLLPAFDHDLVFNPIMCTNCSTRLQMASDFVEECMTTQKIIQKYKETFCPTDELVLCEAVVQNKSKLDLSLPKPNKRKAGQLVKVYTPKQVKLAETIVRDPIELNPVHIEQSAVIIKTEDIELQDYEENLEITPEELQIKEEPIFLKTEGIISGINDTGNTIFPECLVKNEPISMEVINTETINTNSLTNTASVHIPSEVNTTSVVPGQFVQHILHSYNSLSSSAGSANVNSPVIPNDSFPVVSTDVINFQEDQNR